jgi:hypothetical protein
MKEIDSKRSLLISSKNNNEIEGLLQQPVEIGRHEQAEAAVAYSIPGMRPDIL